MKKIKIQRVFKLSLKLYIAIALLFILTVIPFVLSGCATDPVQAFLQALSNYELTAPTITYIAPSSGPAYGGYQATINGTGLLITKSISFGGLTLKPNTDFTVVNDSTIQVTIPGGPQNAGTVDVAVTNNSGLTSLPSQFTYDSTGEIWTKHWGWGMPPTVTSVTPSEGSVNGGTVVTVSGTGFLFGGESMPVSLWQPPTPTGHPTIPTEYPSSNSSVSPSPDNNWGARFTQQQSFTMTMPPDYGRFMQWDVRVYNPWGYSKVSPADVFLQDYPCMHTAPTGLQGYETSTGNLSLSFNGVNCQDGEGAAIVSSYNLIYSTDPKFPKGGNTVTVPNALAHSTTIGSGSLLYGKTYYWEVQAVFEEPNPGAGEGPIDGPWANGNPIAVVAPFTCKPNPLVVKPWAIWEAPNGVALTSSYGIPLEKQHPVTCSDNNKPYASAISSVKWNWGDGTISSGVSGGNVQHLYLNTDNIRPGTGVMNKSYPISETTTLKDGNMATLSENVTVATALKHISSISWITVVGTQPCQHGTTPFLYGNVILCTAPGINPTPEDGILIIFDIANVGPTQSSKPGKIVIKVAGKTVFTFYPMFYYENGVPFSQCPNPPKFPDYIMYYYGNTTGTTGIPESQYCFLNTGLKPNAPPYSVGFLLYPNNFPNDTYPDSWLSPSGLNNGLSVINEINVEYGGCHVPCGLPHIPYSIDSYYSSAYYAPVAGFSFDIGDH